MTKTKIFCGLMLIAGMAFGQAATTGYVGRAMHTLQTNLAERIDAVEAKADAAIESVATLPTHAVVTGIVDAAVAPVVDAVAALPTYEAVTGIVDDAIAAIPPVVIPPFDRVIATDDPNVWLGITGSNAVLYRVTSETVIDYTKAGITHNIDGMPWPSPSVFVLGEYGLYEEILDGWEIRLDMGNPTMSALTRFAGGSWQGLYAYAIPFLLERWEDAEDPDAPRVTVDWYRETTATTNIIKTFTSTDDLADALTEYYTAVQTNTSHIISSWMAADGSLTQQVVRVGAETITNRWVPGVTAPVTNGQQNVTFGMVSSIGPTQGEFRAYQGLTANYTALYPAGIYRFGGANGYLLEYDVNNGNVITSSRFAGSSAIVDGKSSVKLRVDGTERAALTPTGLGIGTNTPAHRLHVSGSAVVEANLFLGPSIGGNRASINSDGSDLFLVTAAGATNALTRPSIIRPVFPSTATVNVTSTQAVYSVSLSSPAVVTQNVAALGLSGTSEASWKLILDLTTTNALSSTIAGVAFDSQPEFTVTGRYEFAMASLDGVKVQAKQTWPETYAWSRSAIGAPNANFLTAAHIFNRVSTNGYFLCERTCLPCPSLIEIRYINPGAGGPVKASITTADFVNFATGPTETNLTVASNPAVVRFALPAAITANATAYRVSLFRLDGAAFGDWAYLLYVADRPLNALERAAYAAGWRP